MNKYVLNGVMLVAGIVVGFVGGSFGGKVSRTDDIRLKQIATDWVKSDEHTAGKATDIVVHLTEDRYGAIMDFNQGGQEMVAFIAFDDLR